MGKGFKHGGGGGSASSVLNFKIVGGTTQPASAANNTIWVNTSANISEWVLSPVAPESPTAGMVWITIGSASGVAFNALKKNGIVIYPIAAKQYIGGVWAVKEAKSYQNGAWADWIPDGAIYYIGNLMQDITGGWTSYAYVVSYGYTGMIASVENGAENLTSEITLGANNRSSFVAPANSIDLTGYNSVEFVFDSIVSSRTDGSMLRVKVYDANGNFVKDGGTAFTSDGEFVDRVTVDVSELSGRYRVGYMMWAQASGVKITAKLKQAVMKK